MMGGKRFSKTGSPTLMSFHHDCAWELKGLFGATGGERSKCQAKQKSKSMGLSKLERPQPTPFVKLKYKEINPPLLPKNTQMIS